MSRLDLLSPATPRLVDAQSRNATTGMDAQDGAGTAQTSDFASLLDGFSGRPPREGLVISDETGLSNSEPDKADSEVNAGADPLQALLPEVATSDNATGAPVLQSVSPVLSVLESILPRILAGTAAGGNPDAGHPGASSASSYPAMLPQEAGELASATAGSAPKLAVSVQNQETHFKPIVEGLIDTSLETEAAAHREEPDLATGAPLIGKPKGTAAAIQHPDAKAGSAQASSGLTGVLEASKEQEKDVAKRVSLDRAPDRPELPKQQSIGSLKADATSLPPSTLQHLAKSIVDDVESLSEPQAPTFQQSGLNRVATARASAGVLRVLDLQLKPAELGLVTIRMRLAGDGIEMEIRAQNDDTADLLRHDAEKLSNLLRASGYRPDAITIQSTEASSHDRASFQRPPQGNQTQGHSFDQGGGAGQGNSPRHQDNRHDSGRRDLSKDGKDASNPGGGGTGGIYL